MEFDRLKNRLRELWGHQQAKIFLAGVLVGLSFHMAYTLLIAAIQSSPRRVSSFPWSPSSQGPAASHQAMPASTPAPSKVQVPASEQKPASEQRPASAQTPAPNQLPAGGPGNVRTDQDPTANSANGVNQYINMLSKVRREHESLPQSEHGSHRESSIRLLNDLAVRLNLKLEEHPQLLKLDQETKAVLQR
jgi:hypothetical protein